MHPTAQNLSRLKERIDHYRANNTSRDDSGGTHTYHSGKHAYPSASEILKTFTAADFAGLPPEKLEEAAHIGTAVHREIDAMLNGEEFLRDEMILGDIRFQSCLLAFRTFYHKYQIVTVATELQLVSPKLGYGGTLDWLGYIDGKLTLIDWKCVAQVSWSHFVQLELYSTLLRDQLNLTPKRKLIVQLKKEGGEYAARECPVSARSTQFAKDMLKFRSKLESFKQLSDGKRRMTI